MKNALFVLLALATMSLGAQTSTQAPPATCSPGMAMKNGQCVVVTFRLPVDMVVNAKGWSCKKEQETGPPAHCWEFKSHGACHYDDVHKNYECNLAAHDLLDPKRDKDR